MAVQINEEYQMPNHTHSNKRNTNDSDETNLCSWEVRESMYPYDK